MTTSVLPIRRLVTGSGARLLIRGFALAVSLVTVPLVTRYLGVEGYGRFAVVMSIFGLLAMTGDFGLPLLAGRDWPTLGIRDRDAWIGALWRTRHFLTIVVCGIALGGLSVAPMESEIRVGLVLVVGGLPLALTGSTAAALFDARLDPLPGALSELAGRLAWIVGVVLLLSWATGVGLKGVVVAAVVAQFVAAGIVLEMGRRRGLVRWRGFTPSRSILVGALPLAALPFLGELYARADTLILALHAPAAHVGVYGLAWRIVEILLALVGSVSAFFVPLYATVGTVEEQGRLHARLVRLLATATLPAATAIAWLARPILSFLGGSGFVEVTSASAPWLRVEWGLTLLMVAFGCFSIAMANGPVLIARNRQGAWIAHLAFFTGANILLNFLLIPRWSLWGAAMATLITACLGIVNSTRLVRRAGVRTGIPGELGWPLVVAAAAAAGTLATGSLPWLMQVLAAGSASMFAISLTPLRSDVRWLWSAVTRS